MAVTITFNGAALTQLAIAGASVDIRRRANRVLNAARAGAPVDTGRLRNSIGVEYFTDGSTVGARIGSNLDYAIWQEMGTGLYGPRHAMIYPKRGRFMVWPNINNSGSGNRRYSGGKTSSFVFAKQVRGVQPTHFLLSALDAAR